MNPVIRQEDGSLLLSLPHAEGLVLCSMPQRIEALLSREGFNRRVVERLFPIAYEDSSREAEYRKLLGDDLRRSKRESMETFKRTLEDLEISQEGIQILIAEEAVGQWLAFLNDLRLYLGIELDITENDWSASIDPDEPLEEEFALLHLLTWLQQCILDAIGYDQDRFASELQEDDPGDGDES